MRKDLRQVTSARRKKPREASRESTVDAGRGMGQ